MSGECGDHGDGQFGAQPRAVERALTINDALRIGTIDTDGVADSVRAALDGAAIGISTHGGEGEFRDVDLGSGFSGKGDHGTARAQAGCERFRRIGRDDAAGHADAIRKVKGFDGQRAGVAAAVNAEVDDGCTAGGDVDGGCGDVRLHVLRRLGGMEAIRVVLPAAAGEVFNSDGDLPDAIGGL